MKREMDSQEESGEEVEHANGGSATSGMVPAGGRQEELSAEPPLATDDQEILAATPITASAAAAATHNHHRTSATGGAATTTSLSLEFQLFPHSEMPLHRQEHGNRPFLFSPVEKKVYQGTVVQIGRKIDRTTEKKEIPRGTQREDRAANNVSVDPNHMSLSDKDGSAPTNTPPEECIAFRSKVVSRHHAEIWVGKDSQLYFRDVGSSSGSFLNRLRLSPTGKESRPYPLKSGDIIQLGVDYQGRQEEIYKAVMIKVFINSKKNIPAAANKQKLNRALRSLIHAMNPNTQKEDEQTPVECCICINAMSPFQALFLAPCSHCFHYKCVVTLLGAGFMFQCPLCRQVANLEASVAEPDDVDLKTEYMEKEDEEEEGAAAMDEDQNHDVGATSSDEEMGNSEHEVDIPVIANSSAAIVRGGTLSAAVNIPGPSRNGGEAAITTPLDHLMSPSTPLNTSNIPPANARSSPRRPDMPVLIFNTLTKLADAISKDDRSSVDSSIDEYTEQMKTLLSGLAGSNEGKELIIRKLIKSLTDNPN